MKLSLRADADYHKPGYRACRSGWISLPDSLQAAMHPRTVSLSNSRMNVSQLSQKVTLSIFGSAAAATDRALRF
jgi:hypothetical protein